MGFWKIWYFCTRKIGSLISIRKNTKDIIIPSGETRINMYPMDYEEFRWALGDSASIPLLKQFYDKRLPLRQALPKAMRDFRLYMLIGGMPQAVNEYLETNNLSKCFCSYLLLWMFSDPHEVGISLTWPHSFIRMKRSSCSVPMSVGRVSDTPFG